MARALPRFSHSTGTNRMTTLGLAPDLLLAQAPTGGGGSLMPFLVQFLLMVRPQQKQRRKHEDALRALKRGDEVVTTGGIVGEVIHIRETSKDGGANRLDDRVTIKSAESRLVVERGRIAKILGTGTTSSSSSSDTTSKT